MTTYVIGDVQGAYAELMDLLDLIAFAGNDRLWFVGDLVNRGRQSLSVLRFVQGLGSRAVTVLGNHELHLIAMAEGLRRPKSSDTCQDILDAPDRAALIEWLRQRPLLHHDAGLGYTMVHAGLAPPWTLDMARSCAAEVEAQLRSASYRALLQGMYGDGPDLWSCALKGIPRWRFIINALTRMRMCDRQGRLVLSENGSPWGRDDGLVPWFEVPGRATQGAPIVFGHWSALGRFHAEGIDALDTGCIWGGALTALPLDGDQTCFQLPCRGYVHTS